MVELTRSIVTRQVVHPFVGSFTDIAAKGVRTSISFLILIGLGTSIIVGGIHLQNFGLMSNTTSKTANRSSGWRCRSEWKVEEKMIAGVTSFKEFRAAEAGPGWRWICPRAGGPRPRHCKYLLPFRRQIRLL